MGDGGQARPVGAVGAVDAATWNDRVGGRLDSIRAADRWRQPRDLAPTGAVTGEIDGQSVVSFAANDYLGLTHHPKVIAAATGAAERWGTGSGASRLVVGSRPVHGELEAALAEWKKTEACLLFPTGFAANLGVLTAFGGAEAVVFSDALNHASIIDGCRLAKAPSRVYRHGDLEHLEQLLVGATHATHATHADGGSGAEARLPLIVTDTVFSMDGDLADLDGLLELAARFGALLVLDEAHAALGPDLPAAGALPPVAAAAEVPVLRVGTLSKTLGSLGGFVAGPKPYVDYLVNVARPFIFTTATPPADAAAALAALEVITSPEGDVLVGKLRHHVDRIAARLGEPLHSPIVPVVLGEEQAALDAAAALRERGLLVPAIRPPTVAEGTSRLRVALSAAHENDQVTALLDGLDEVAPGWASSVTGPVGGHAVGGGSDPVDPAAPGPAVPALAGAPSAARR